MIIQLGNLSTKEICERLQITLTDQEIESLESIRSELAEVSRGRWHGFDMPFVIYCGDMETAVIVRDTYAPYSSKMVARLRIQYNQELVED